MLCKYSLHSHSRDGLATTIARTDNEVSSQRSWVELGLSDPIMVASD